MPYRFFEPLFKNFTVENDDLQLQLSIVFYNWTRRTKTKKLKPKLTYYFVFFFLKKTKIVLYYKSVVLLFVFKNYCHWDLEFFSTKRSNSEPNSIKMNYFLNICAPNCCLLLSFLTLFSILFSNSFFFCGTIFNAKN